MKTASVQFIRISPDRHYGTTTYGPRDGIRARPSSRDGIDNRNESDWTREIADPYVIERDSDLELRRLHDEREFHVVEVFYEPGELQLLLGDEGWTARLDATPWFIFGEACLAGSSQPARPGAEPNAR